MDIELNPIKKALGKTVSSGMNISGDRTPTEDDAPYSWKGTTNLLLGFLIALASISIPILVVILEKPSDNERINPTVLEPYGSKPSPTFSVSRLGEFNC